MLLPLLLSLLGLTHAQHYCCAPIQWEANLGQIEGYYKPSTHAAGIIQVSFSIAPLLRPHIWEKVFSPRLNYICNLFIYFTAVKQRLSEYHSCGDRQFIERRNRRDFGRYLTNYRTVFCSLVSVVHKLMHFSRINWAYECGYRIVDRTWS